MLECRIPGTSTGTGRCMNTKTLHALELDIGKWEGYTAAIDKTGPDDCIVDVTDAVNELINFLNKSEIARPLCQLFIWDICKKCPVMKKTGISKCRNSPKKDVVKALKAMKTKPDLKPLKAACHAEIKFLKALLPRHPIRDILSKIKITW
jgi:hypothetical protein